MKRDRLVPGPSLKPADQSRFLALLKVHAELFVSLDGVFSPERAAAIMVAVLPAPMRKRA